MLIVIRGQHLPGRRFPDQSGVYENVHVGLQLKPEPSGLVPGDAPAAEWQTEVELIERNGVRDFRGPAVQGRAGARFLYLTWGDVDGETFTMFRRAKLMLAEIPDPRASARAIASVRLTDPLGGPICSRLKPPALTWTTR